MNTEHIPLTSPSIHSYTAEGFREYVKGLKIGYMARMKTKADAKRDPNASPVPDISYTVNKKGTQILTVRNRKPKWITRNEITLLSEHYKVSYRELWNLCSVKDISVNDNMIKVGK